MTEWPATLDRRYHDVVIFDLACVVVETAPETVQARDSTPLLLRRLRDVGIATAVYSRDPGCRQSLCSAGLDGFVDVAIDARNPRLANCAFLVEVAARLDARPERSVVIGCDRPGVEAAIDNGFGLIIGVAHRPDAGTELLACGADTVVDDLAGISVRSGGTAIANIADAVEVYNQLKELVAVRRPAVFLDFDGTLSDIVEHPESATLVAGAAAALRALAEQCPVTVISGRDLADVRGRVNVEGIWYAGSHGFELLEPDRTHHEKTSATEVVDALSLAATRLTTMLADISGIRVEHKRFAVTIHYRNVDAGNVGRVIATVRKYGHAEGLRASLGRKVIELRPNTLWNKGTTLDWLLEHIESRNAGSSAMLPIYIGDDLTDEDAFDAVEFDGVGIVVRHDEDGNRSSAALFSLGSPAAVCGFIRRLADDLQEIAATPADPWELVYDGYRPEDERLREALCTVGNGYVATRGCAPEASASAVHYPGTYAAGVYNQLSDRISGRTVENESLVNLPNWLSLTFRLNDGPWFCVDDAELISYRQIFDLRHATLTRTIRFRDSAGHETTLSQQRFASMHQPHLLAMRTTISAENWSGTVEFRSLLDGSVRNTLVERYRPLSDTHLADSAIDDIGPTSVLLQTQTSQSRIAIAIAMRSTVWRDEVRAEARYRTVREGGRGGHDIQLTVSAGQSVTLEKVATIVTGRDSAISEPASAASHYLDESGRYADLHHQHARAWARLWEQCAVNLDDNTVALRILRLHLVHVLQTISPHTAELDAGVPARGLHGEAYRGHVFWDSLFIAPVLSVRMPNLARSLLLYRYRRLPQARRAARRAGYRGAMYPWQSGSDGREVSQQLHLNPQSGKWNPDPSARAHHVGLAIAFNAWQHYQVTGDRQYLVDYGAEMMVEIARFWVGLAKFDGRRARYTINGIIGPDEFHSGYPGMQDDGIDNNAYTNVMAVWVILRAMDALDMLPLRDRLDLVGRIDLTAEELDRWEHVTRRMFVPFHDGVISQFEGYENLAELNWEHYRRRYGNIQRLDRILDAEDDSVNNYKASKQADALMLFYLLSSEELLNLFGRLGYRFAPEQIPKTVDYYLARTSHGSTLSAVVHSWVLARGNRQLAMDYFGKVLESDIADIQGGTTSEGIHLAAMAGSVDLLQRCFTGLEMRDDRLILGPLWPETLGPMEFAIVYRGQRLHLRIKGRSATVTAEAGKGQPIELECRGRVRQLAPGHTIEVG
ncbi:trehalose-phosphatase [Mycobacterium vulneris]|uniref:Trehalose-phosphatase n=1 Tax=Mycolicibacterium vulneris TaxID=547163 RepID=A0A1X2KRN7_9MYCO|nr:trehalose-phosphatase [Mycolicibacterium vulneris]OSC24424.1 trehalose-phosphatase [Mycolicibacterium vulneris]